MFSKARLTILVTVIIAGGMSLYLLGCEADPTAPTDPEVNYLPQTFSLAVADGSASADGYAHNGVAVITLDWNNDTPGANVVAPMYIKEYAGMGYPDVDGGLSTDAGTWAQAPETVLTLGNMYGNGGVTTVRVKAVYTFVNPPRVWFLLRWDDAADLRQEDNSGYLGNAWEYVSASGGGDERWENQWGNNDDWVAFMWDTWNRVYPNPQDTRDFYFTSKTSGFQSNGCSITCHEDVSPLVPHHTSGATEVCDLWVWTGTRTNYTAELLDWGTGADDPAYLFDTLVNQTGFSWGTSDAYPRDAAGDYLEWLSFDEGVSPYVINDETPSVGYPDYASVDDPGANVYYLWFSDESVQDMAIAGEGVSPTDDDWVVGDIVAGYLHRSALGGAADVVGHGGWADGTWTLEVQRNIGGNYDEINSEEDVFLGIFEAHPDE